MRALLEYGLDQQTIVVLTSDHGEEFLDHAGVGHGRTLYEESIRVPLVIRSPGVAPRVVESPVSLAALASSALELVGVAAPAGALATASLAPPMRGETDVAPEVVFAELDAVLLRAPDEGAARPAPMRALISGDFKLIRDPTRDLQLYDLPRDPGERHNLASEQPEVVARLLTLLDRHVAAFDSDSYMPRTPRAPTARSNLELEKLRALGYTH